MTETSTPTAASGEHWTALIGGAVATMIVTGLVDSFIVFAQSGTCNKVGAPHDILVGQIWLGIVLAIALLTWGLTLWGSRNRVAVTLAAGLAVFPATVFALNGLSTQSWAGSFCL